MATEQAETIGAIGAPTLASVDGIAGSRAGRNVMAGKHSVGCRSMPEQEGRRRPTRLHVSSEANRC